VYVVSAEDLFGAKLESSQEAHYDITLEQVETLQRELLDGGARKLAMKVPSQIKHRDTFGGPLAVAPAAMFAACRKVKLGDAQAPGS
jgi:hypothetical protein